MIIKLSWKNIWRNKIRSFVVITAITVGLWAGLFASAFVSGLMSQKVQSVIQDEVSHIQIHHPKFRSEHLPKQNFSIPENLRKELESNSQIKAFSTRLISFGMINSANQSGSIQINGIDPQTEDKVTKLKNRLIEGAYFEGIKRNPVLISKKIAEKYKIKTRSKVVLTFQDVDYNITSAAFRVVGIIDSHNGVIDEKNIYVQYRDLQKVLGIEQEVYEIAILLKEHNLAEQIAQELQAKHSDLEILPWMDLSTGMRFMIEAMDTYTYILVGIILLALMFSIINTMLMAVLERTREVGMLMAIGMSRSKIFTMIMLETIYLSILGGPIGILVSVLFIQYFGKNGIHLADSGYEDLGFSNTVFPSLPIESYLIISIMVLVMAILSAIYPARKALQLNPVEAIRKL